MEQGQDFRQIVFRMAEANQPTKKSWLKFRETLGTMICGTLSTSIGVVVLILGVVGASGFRSASWHDLFHGGFLLSFNYGMASIVGEGLGLAGLAIGKLRDGAISPLSAVGTVVCLAQMYLLFGQFLVRDLF
jgi:hypothetical protein